CLKAPKILKHVRKLRIDGWEFVAAYVEQKNAGPEELTEDSGVEPSEVFIQNIVAGRPVLCHPSRPGGLRLRYGRTRATGLAAVALHPATMHILDDFIAVGTQIKTERPGKAGAVTPCDSIEGPLVVLESGDFIAVTTESEARELRPKVKRIADLGEILVPYGEFLENNHPLVPGSFAIEWYREELRAAAGELPADWEAPSWDRAVELSREHRVPLHPKYNLFWHDHDVETLLRLKEAIARGGRMEGESLVVPFDGAIQEPLTTLGATHTLRGTELI